MKRIKTISGVTIRNYKGYYQELRIYDMIDPETGLWTTRSCWVFFINDDHREIGTDSFCYILRSDKSQVRIPIDRHGNITVCGKKFTDWNYYS